MLHAEVALYFPGFRGSPIGFSGSGIFLIRSSEFGNFKAKLGRDSGLKVSSEGGMPEISLGITRLNEILGQNSEIKELYWVHSETHKGARKGKLRHVVYEV